MTEPDRATQSGNAARIALASLMVAASALAMAGQAAAEPVEPFPVPVPSDPAAVAAAPGAPVVNPAEAPLPPPPPAPVGPPVVPEISNPVYGQGQSGSPLGYLGDIWRAARSGDPVGALAGTPENAPAPPPPGAGPAPALPPGFVSMTAPESTTSATSRSSAETNQGGPALPEGYFPLSGPPPPGWYDGSTQPIFGPGAPPPGAPVPPTP